MICSPLSIQPLGPAIGALVSGLRLADGIDDTQRDAWLAALLKHQVLYFKNQPIDPVAQRALAARFGSLHTRSTPLRPACPRSSCSTPATTTRPTTTTGIPT